MIKRILIFAILLIIATACGSTTRSSKEPYDLVNEVVERAPDTQNIQFLQSQVLPPYGLKAMAETSVLELRIHSSEKEALNRMEDIQNTIDEITTLATTNNAMSIQGISVNQVSGSYVREEISTPNIQNLDTSAVTIKLASDLSQYDYDFVKSITAFNDFLNTLNTANLPDTITVQVLSVEAEPGDLEAYRSQIISQVYQEVNAIKDEYGQAVKFEITGLHTPLKKIQLSDTEYYLYLEPVVTALEF
jgi:hypothetical protein